VHRIAPEQRYSRQDGRSDYNAQQSKQIRGNKSRDQHTRRMDTQGLRDDPGRDKVVKDFVN
jgi:hypothetical protein